MLASLSTALLVLLLLSIPVAAVLFILAFSIDICCSPFPLIRALGQNFWSSSNSFLLMAIPLFIFMGEIIVRSGVAAKAYLAMERWLGWLPGGLLHANVATSALFSATSGSSVATAATVSAVAMPQAKALGYDAKLFSGSIAAGGTLGILIPPSVNLIVYGFLTDTSIPKLFIAGLIPGILLAMLFMLAGALLCWCWPHLGGQRQRFSREEKWQALPYLLPLLLLFAIIVGTIYTGWATPTEAAAVGCLAAVIIAIVQRTFNLQMLIQAASAAVSATAMLMFIILAASFLNFVLASSGIIHKLGASIETAGLSAYGLLFVVFAVLFILGFFIETLSLMVITIPIFVPLLIAQGFNSIWFGIVMIVFVEMALITPPVGLNLYIVQSARKGEPFSDVLLGILPYIACMLLLAGLLVLFPQLALWLPSLL